LSVEVGEVRFDGRITDELAVPNEDIAIQFE
jgi:hypothetical protein